MARAYQSAPAYLRSKRCADEALLDEVKFEADGWPSINGGKGPSTNAPSPFGIAQKKAELNFSDDFSDPKLGAGWQWPVADEPRYRIENGFLLLSPNRKTNDLVGAVLARSTTIGDYTADATIGEPDPGVFAGIAAFGDPANSIGLATGDGKLLLWFRHKGKHEILAETPAPKAKEIHLRLLAKDGHRFQFFARGDKKDWTPIGRDLQGKHLPPWDRNVRIALTAGGAENAVGKFARVEILRENAR